MTVSSDKKRASHFSAGPSVLLDHINLEADVSVENHRTVRACVSPRFAERTWCNSGGINTVDVPIVDVESWHTQELIVESVEKIGTQLQAETLVEFNVLSHGQVQLVAGHGAEAIATR